MSSEMLPWFTEWFQPANSTHGLHCTVMPTNILALTCRFTSSSLDRSLFCVLSLMAALFRWCRVTQAGCSSSTGPEQCVPAVTARLSLFVTTPGGCQLFLLTVWPWLALQLQLCISEPKASAKWSLSKLNPVSAHLVHTQAAGIGQV